MRGPDKRTFDSIDLKQFTMNSFRKGPVGGVVFGMHITPLNTGKIKLNDELVVLN